MSRFWKLGGSYIDEASLALIFSDGTSVSYGALREMAASWREHLLALAEGQPCLVVLEFETTCEAIAAYLGALDSGLALVVSEPGHAGSETPLRQTYAPEILIGRGSGGGALEPRRLASPGRAVGAPTLAPHPDLRLLLSTSGSTGDPKLVRLSGENIDSNARSIAQYLSITHSDRAMLTLPLFYSYGISVLNSYLSAGASLVLNDRSVVDPGFWPVFRDADATSLALVPHQFDLLEGSGFLEKGDELAPGLRYITQAGGRLDPDTARRFAVAGRSQGWNLVMMYGQTEAAPRISWVPPEALPEAADTIGRAIPGGHLWLADENGNEITVPLTPGELVYEGPNVMMGYARDRADLARNPETPELRTGDIAELTETGLFRVVGRLKRFVKLYGLRLSLDQIEALLGRAGLKAEAVAVQDQLVLLHLDPDRGEEVRRIVAEEYDLPPSILHVAPLKKLPLLSSGKTDRPALQRLAEKVLEAASSAVAPGAEADLAEVLARATRSRHVAPGDSFNSLGGDSLSYLQVQMILEDRLGRAPDGWETMTLAQLKALEPVAVRRPGWGQINIDVLLRLAAISLVVAQHVSDYPLYGGTWILVLLIGYSAARFQVEALREGRVWNLARNMLYPIIPLYFLILLAYQSFRDQVPMEHFALLGNYYVWEDSSSFLTTYWFVSLYAHIVALLLLAAWVPVFRRALVRHQVTTPLILAAGINLFLTALLLSGQYLEGREGLWPIPHVASHGLLECLPLVLLGWALFARQKAWQLPIILGLTLWFCVLLNAMGVAAYSATLLLASTALLATGLRVAVPRAVARGLQQAAALTLFVYLLHNAVVWPIRYSGVIDIPQPVGIAVVLLGSFALAAVAKAAFDTLESRLRRTEPSRPIEFDPAPET